MAEPPARSSRKTLILAAALLAVGLLAWFLFLLDRRSDEHRPMTLCRALEKAGTVTRCTLQKSELTQGVIAEQVVRFEVKHAGRRAYSGTMAEFRDEARMNQFLRAAREAHAQSARKTAAAAEIASRGRVIGTSILPELAPVQAANAERALALDLKPVYGGPQQQAAAQVEAIRAQLTK